MSKLHESRPAPQSKSKIEISSWGKDSMNRKKINVMIIEASSLQIHEMRATIQKSFQAYSDDFHLSFFYNERLANSLDDIINFEESRQAHLHFVVVALERHTSPEIQKQVSATVHKTISFWGERRQAASQVLLVNNSGHPLKSYLGLESGDSPALSQLQIFKGYPTEMQLRKFLSPWIKKYLPEHL